jgi:DMSO/TMAO reductase YedYZ molybdopterin-dependent catalytic subunit
MSEPVIPPNAIVSPDTARDQRLPPHQVVTRKWPVLHAGETPVYTDLDREWDFYVFGAVEQKRRFTWAEFAALPRVTVHADMHCVTRWSKLDNVWEGVPTRELLKHVTPKPAAKFVMVHCEYGFTTNLPLDDFFGDDCLFALTHNGQPLEPDNGSPVRLVVPRLYAWKSAKWVRGVEFMDRDRPGFWESWEHGGYHMRGDPWAEERFRPTGG